MGHSFSVDINNSVYNMGIIDYIQASHVALVVKNPPANAGDGFGPWVGKIPLGRTRQPTPVWRMPWTEYRGARWATVHRVAKSRTQLSTHADFIPRALLGSYNRTPEKGDRAPVTYPDY